jgi:hypothetical protein
MAQALRRLLLDYLSDSSREYGRSLSFPLPQNSTVKVSESLVKPSHEEGQTLDSQETSTD